MPTIIPTQALRAGALAAAFLCAPAAHAASLSFDFTFNNALQGGGVVTGVVEGLSEGTGPALSVLVLTNTAGFGIGEYIGDPRRNTWTVSSGVLTSFDFLAFGTDNTPPEVTGSSLILTSAALGGVSNRAALSSSGAIVRDFSSGVSEQDIALTFTPRPATAVIPLPAAGWLLLGGLGALAGLGAARRKRTTA